MEETNVFRKTSVLSMALCLMIFLAGCSSEPDEPAAIMEGTLTVDSELDSSGDYSGIEVLSTTRNLSQEIDTLFYAVTDTSGRYRGEVTAEEKDLYPVVISRNGNRLGIVNLVFADGDTIRFDAELPNVNQTASIESRENDAYEQFDRVQRNFNRVVNYVNSRGMSSDSLETEILKWSDLFWDLYQQYPDYLAGERAASTSISILQEWDDEMMLTRTDSLLSKYNRLPGGLRSQLTQFYAERDSLERSLTFLEDLENREQDPEKQLPIQREKIQLLFDSSRTDRAVQLLQQFRETYSENSAAMDWAEGMKFDLENLAPGKPFPAFEFRESEGGTVSSETLQNQNSPYMIEFTRLNSPEYLQQYERSVAIHQIYQNVGLRIVTVPLNTGQTTFQAFFEERNKFWDFAEPESFSSEEIIERYNINRLPTRFLVNNEGVIIQRYVGAEFDRVVQGLQKIITQEQTES